MSVVLCFVYFLPAASLLEKSSLLQQYRFSLEPSFLRNSVHVKVIDKSYKIWFIHVSWLWTVVYKIPCYHQIAPSTTVGLSSSKLAPGKYVNMNIDNVCFEDCK